MRRTLGWFQLRRMLRVTVLLSLSALALVLGFSSVRADSPSFTVVVEQQKNLDAGLISQGVVSLTLKPGEKQQFTLGLTNTTRNTNRLKITPTVAQTNDAGQVDMTLVGRKPDASLHYPLTKLISGPTAVTLAPGGSESVTYTVKAPAKPFSGRIIGGLVISSDNLPSVNEDGKKAKAHTFSNNIQQSITVGLTSTEPPEKSVAPNLDMGAPKLTIGYFNRPSVIIDLRNIEPAILRGLTGTVDISQQGAPTNSFRYRQGTIEMAPNSYMQMTIPWGTTNVSAGTYQIHFKFSAGVRTWEFDRTLVVSSHHAEAVNSTSNPNRNNTLLWWVMGSILVFVLFVTGSVLMWHLGRKKGIRSIK